jgi:hypothetical protein
MEEKHISIYCCCCCCSPIVCLGTETAKSIVDDYRKTPYLGLIQSDLTLPFANLCSAGVLGRDPLAFKKIFSRLEAFEQQHKLG